jgi:hypothetical protein
LITFLLSALTLFHSFEAKRFANFFSSLLQNSFDLFSEKHFFARTFIIQKKRHFNRILHVRRARNIKSQAMELKDWKAREENFFVNNLKTFCC